MINPFRSPPLSAGQTGWLRPAAAVVLALYVPSLLAGLAVYVGGLTVTGPPKDGSGYTIVDHISFVLASLTASVVVSWMFAPVALLVLRAAVMLGYAGWGTAVLASVVLGVPAAYFILNGELRTEAHNLVPHIVGAIGLLGLSVWAAFWGLTAIARKSPKFARK